MFQIVRNTRKMFGMLMAVTLLLALSGCEDSDYSAQSGKSSVGNFLAASYAYRNNDYNKTIYYQKRALSTDPNNPTLLRKLYGLMILTGHYDEAIILARKHLSMDKDAYFAELILALNSFKDHKFEEASNRAHTIYDQKNKTISSEIRNIILPSLILWSSVGQKSFDHAIKLFENTTSIDGLKDFNAYQHALIYELAGDINEAKKLFDQLTITPYSYKITKTAVEFYHRNGFVADAGRAINAYYSNNPKHLMATDQFTDTSPMQKLDAKRTANLIMASVLSEVASLLSSTNQLDEAILYFRLSLLLNHKDDATHILLAGTLERKGLLGQALAIYQAIPETSRYKHSTQQDIALLYNKMGKQDQAKAMLITISEETPERVDALLNLGDILVSNKKFLEAIPTYKKAISRLEKTKKGVESKHWPIFYALAICYEQSKQWALAEKIFLQTLELSPDEPDVVNYLAYSWLMQDINIHKAEKMLRGAVQRRPQDAHVLDSYGWSLYKLGKYKEALFFLEQANARIPYDPTTNDHLGDIYWKSDRKTEAVYMWKRALVFKPKSIEVTAIKEKIKFGYNGAEKPTTLTKHPKMVKSDHIMQQ